MAQTKAYVLIETSIGKARDVAAALRKLRSVTSVDVVTGPFDVIAVVETDSLGSIGGVVTGQIHSIGGTVRTVTCMSISTS